MMVAGALPLSHAGEMASEKGQLLTGGQLGGLPSIQQNRAQYAGGRGRAANVEDFEHD